MERERERERESESERERERDSEREVEQVEGQRDKHGLFSSGEETFSGHNRVLIKTNVFSTYCIYSLYQSIYSSVS